MTQATLSYRTNRDLFSNHYLDEHLPDTEPWEGVPEADIEAAYEEIRDLYEGKRERVEDYNEAQLERNVIRPVFDILDIPFEIEETVQRNARRPDYGFFETEAAADAAFDREDFYEEAIAVADAKRWGRKLDTRGEEKRDFENPSYQIHSYLQETPVSWAVLTNGKRWRLYYGPTSHRLDSYYEIDVPTLLEYVEGEGDIEAFKEFYLFFRRAAFVEDATGDCFLDDVYDESTTFAEALGEDLQENIYEAIRVLADGFLDTNDGLGEAELDLVHDSSLIYLYRLIFVLYAESEGRELLPTDNDIYAESYSLNELKRTVTAERDETQQHHQTWQTTLWDRLEELFVLIDQGSKGQDIPEEQLYIPAYNGGLFRTNPDEDDSVESRFLSEHEVGDAYLAEVIDLLTRREAEDGEGQVFVDYSSLDERNLGSIYEGLLEYKLDVAEEALTVADGEYVPAAEGDDVAVEEGEVYLRTDDGERKATGSYYTPEYVVEYIVDETLGPLVDDIRADLVSASADTTHQREGGFAEEFAERVFDLTVLDPAMGSGHFPVNAVDYLAREIIDAQERQDQQDYAADEADVRPPTTEEGELRDINWARRKVAQRCIFGVDVNPLATELAKVSLWLRTLAAEQPLAFLDHHLKTGNSLVGSDIEDVLAEEGDDTEAGQLTLQQSFEHTRQRAMEHVTERFQELLAIDNETLADIKEMEAVYEDVREDPLYRKLLAMANVHTAGEFGLDVPADADERMAEALRDENWDEIEGQDWFTEAQALAEEEAFFHWELEFPTVFYGAEDGKRKEDAGFDAVIGNPPWLNAWNMTEESPDYRDKLKSIFSDYDEVSGHWDLFIPFILKALELCKEGGNHSYILPSPVLAEKYATELRGSLLSNHAIKSILTFGEENVFEDVDRQSAVYVLRKGKQIPKSQELRQGTTEPFRYQSVGSVEHDTWYDRYNHQIRVDEDFLTYLPILERIEERSDRVGDHLYVNYGAQVSSKEKGDFTKSDVVHEEQIKDGKIFFEGADVDRYHCSWPGKYLDYRPDEMYGPRSPELFESNKLAVSVRTDGNENLTAGFDGDGMYCDHTVILCCYYSELEGSGLQVDFEGYADKKEKPNLHYVLAQVNSKLVSWFFQNKFATGALQGDYSDVWPESVRRLPIKTSVPGKSIEDLASTELAQELIGQEWTPELTIPTVISKLSKKISSDKDQRSRLNLSLLDYLGNYTEGPALPDIGLYQPTESNILDATTEDYEKLQIERARTTREGHSVTVEATARYKPEDEDEYETDTYGYTETEFVEAFTLADLSENEAALVEAFVPVAVAEAGGFAGFRDNATKTNSLLDRLKAMTLPDPEAVAEDLERYRETKARADELDEKIEKTDRLIDEIVYDLYELSDEEIEIVEEAVED